MPFFASQSPWPIVCILLKVPKPSRKDHIMKRTDPPAGTHVAGVTKGEERGSKGAGAGRGEKEKKGYRSAADSTGVNPKGQAPIDPKMTQQPPP